MKTWADIKKAIEKMTNEQLKKEVVLQDYKGWDYGIEEIEENLDSNQETFVLHIGKNLLKRIFQDSLHLEC